MDLIPISSQTAGPFFHLGCTDRRSVASLVTDKTRGERIRLICRVLDGAGAPVPDAMTEIWQADAEGKYPHWGDPQGKDSDPFFHGFGRLATNEQGRCVFETIKPGNVPANDGGLQASHINVSVFARGILKRLATRIYFAGDPELQADPVLALVPPDRRATLLARSDNSRAGEWHFDIHLCGERETVFFDV
ncbi:MAG: protocatechuate 3,4-dioxygenase subunit alpha [Candidatus Binatia bacterium]